MRGGCRAVVVLGCLILSVVLLSAAADAQSGIKPRKPVPTSEPPPPQTPAKTRAVPAPPPTPGQDEKNQPVVIDADSMESLKREGLVIFTGNVVAHQNNSVQYADRMEVYLDERGERVLRTVSTGNVRIITRDCRIGTAQRGEYDELEQRVVLIGNARVWQEENVITGERITIYLAEERSIVQGGKQERVKAIFHPKSEERQKGAAGAPSCR